MFFACIIFWCHTFQTCPPHWSKMFHQNPHQKICSFEIFYTKNKYKIYKIAKLCNLHNPQKQIWFTTLTREFFFGNMLCGSVLHPSEINMKKCNSNDDIHDDIWITKINLNHWTFNKCCSEQETKYWKSENIVSTTIEKNASNVFEGRNSILIWESKIDIQYWFMFRFFLLHFFCCMKNVTWFNWSERNRSNFRYIKEHLCYLRKNLWTGFIVTSRFIQTCMNKVCCQTNVE